MKRTCVLLIGLSTFGASGCGRGDVTENPKQPEIVIDASKKAQPEAADPAAKEALRKGAEDIERRAAESKKADKDPVFACNMMWAANAWLKADDKSKALAAAKTAIAAGPDDRGSTYTFVWYSNIADVLESCGELPLAITHFEAAVKAAPDPISLSRTEKRLAEAKAKLSK